MGGWGWLVKKRGDEVVLVVVSFPRLLNVAATCSVPKGRICIENVTFGTQAKVADQTWYLTREQCTHTMSSVPTP